MTAAGAPPRSPPPAGPRTMSPPLPHRPRRRTDANRCPHWVDGDGPARFTLNAYFVWQQEFPAKVRVQIRHTSISSLSINVPQPSREWLESYAKTPVSNRRPRPACSVVRTRTVWNGPTCATCARTATTGTARSSRQQPALRPACWRRHDCTGARSVCCPPASRRWRCFHALAVAAGRARRVVQHQPGGNLARQVAWGSG